MSSNSPASPFRIAIVGGGIGGLFCALSVHHHCTSVGANFHIDVYEQAFQYKEIGAGIGIGRNAAKLAHKLGLGSTGSIWLFFCRYDDSREIVTIPVHPSVAIRQSPCARSAFLDLLREAIEERKAATLHTKKTCRRLEDLEDSVRMIFADGTTAEADIVIACDGVHSAVRDQFAFDHAYFSGKVAYRGIKSLTGWPFPSWGVSWLAKGRHLLVFPINNNNHDLNIVAFVTKGEEGIAGVKESWTSICDRKEVEDDFAGFDKPVQQIIGLMPERTSKWRINDRRPLDRWHHLGGKVVLLGDAAHCMTPHLGAGAGQAMEDGWIVARAISEYLDSRGRPDRNPHFDSLESTAQLYQDVRLRRAQKVQISSRAAGETYEMQAEEIDDKSYDECCGIMAERTLERLKWVFEEDLDAAYAEARDGGRAVGTIANVNS